MTNSPPASRGWFSRCAEWLPLVLILALLLSSWLFLVNRSDEEDARAIQDALATQVSIANAVAQHTEHLFNGLRLLNQSLAASRTEQQARRLLGAVQGNHGGFLRLLQFDADGRLRQASGKAPEAWLQENAVDFAARLRTASDELTWVGETPTEQIQAWSLPFFYAPAPGTERQGSGRQPRTFTAAMIDIGQFQKYFGDVGLGRGGEVLLIADDGRVLLRLREGRIESPSAARMYWEHAACADRAAPSGDPIYVCRKAASVPLSVIVSRPRAEVLAVAHSVQRVHMSSVLLLTVMILGLTFLWIKTTLRREKLILSLTVAQANNERLITQIGNEKETAYHLATHDRLTGLPNRMLFADLAQRYIARAQRMRGGFALMFIDLDRFKPVNDLYGHKAGDQLLIVIAQRLKDCVRHADVVSRFGGDEFVVLVSELRNNHDVSVVADKLVDTLSQPCEGIVDGIALRVTPSIGIAFYPDDASDIDALLRQADTAMYQAKEKGRATYVFADPLLNRRYEISNQIEAALPAAIAAGDIHVFYQPKVRLGDFSLSGLEALARWEHAQLGSISPSEFIPVAEKSGLIVELGELVLEQVCRQLRAWMQAGVPVLPVAVNVSTRQLRPPGFAEYVAEIIADHGIPPELLEIEITETGLIGSDEAIPATLHALSALGIRLAIDDFGTGYSGLSHLRKLPASFLKIDRLFIKDIRNDISDATIVSTTISLAHNLHLETIAEGVETHEQLAHLKTARCDQAQGFLFSPPCPPAAAEALLYAGRILVDPNGKG